MKATYWIIGLALLASCKGQTEDPPPAEADTDTDTDTDTDADSDTDVDCENLDVGTCAAEAACDVIVGQEIFPAGEGVPNCFIDEADLGCVSVTADCTTVITHAADPADTSICFEFANGCIPTGWVACDPDPGPTTEDCP